MKIVPLIEHTQSDPVPDVGTGAIRSFLNRSAQITRSLPPAATHSRRARPMEPPPLNDEIAPITVSVEAAYLMVGDRYDPHAISPNHIGEMMELLIGAGIATRADQTLLMRGPRGKGYPLLECGKKRNIVAEWQDHLALGVGKSNLNAVSRATRALNILGKVSVTRLPR